MKRILTKLLLLICAVVYSQNDKSNYPNFIGQNLKVIENNSDWIVLQKSSGDLNNDGLNDYAIILESKDSILEKRCSSCKLLKNKTRIIVVLLDQNEKEKVITQNNSFIARGDEGGMLPHLEPELSIENGLMTIYYQYTRANQSYTFQLKNNRMEILKAESNGIHSASGNYENEKYDFTKGEIIIETGNISTEKTIKDVIKIDVKPKLLSEFGKMYDWKVIENKYL